MTEIVFIGLGKMGAPMAGHLLAAGHQVVGVDIDAQRRAEFAAAGGRAVESAAQALAGLARPLVISSLPDDAALRAVAEELAGELASTARGAAAWIETSTVSLEASRFAAERCAQAGLAYLCAPVSGNAPMAQRAQLSVLASGDRASFERCEALFACWGARRSYLGAGEEARVCKLVLNLMVAGTAGLLAEALALGQRGGVPWAELWRAIEGSAVASPLVLAKAPALQAHDYTPTFTVMQMRKDLALIQDAARALGLATPHAALVDAALAQAAGAGAGELDFAVIVRDQLKL